jgi:hypothetical protein
MPLFRYFVFAGGFLLCFLFVTNVVLPKQPAREVKDFDRTILRMTHDPNEDLVSYPDMFLAMPKRPQTTDRASLPTRTRQALAAMRSNPKHTAAQRLHRDSDQAPPNGFIRRPNQPDGFPIW